MKNLYLLLLILPGFLVAQIDLTPPASYKQCDVDSDGTEIFDLTAKNAEILGSLDPTLYSIAYFESLTNANANVNPVNASSYTAPSYPQVLWARVWENANTANFDTVPLSLLLQNLPTASVTASDDVCVSGFAYFMFTANNGTPPYSYNYTINGGPVQTITSSGTGSSALISVQNNEPATFILELTSVTESSMGCSRNLSQTVDITIHPSVTFVDPQDITIADTPFDGIAQFDLTSQATIALGGQSGYTAGLFLSLADAESNSNQLSPGAAAAFQNTSNPQTIWVAVSNDVTGCRAITDFHLILTPPDTGIVYIPDAALKAKLLEANTSNSIAYGNSGYVKIDTNSDAEIQQTEAEAITKLDVSYSTIVDLTGVEKFINLNKFESTNNLNLSIVNVAQLVQLDTLKLINGKLTGLSLPSHPDLKYLDLQGNKVSSLVIGNSPNLGYLSFYGNKIVTFDFAAFINLHYLNCGYNGMTSLNVSAQANLEHLNCTFNRLYSLNLQNLQNLTYLDCSTNEFSGLDLSPVSNLSVLKCEGNDLVSLDLSPVPNLIELNCEYNKLTALDASQMTSLEQLICNENNLSSLDVTGCANLKYLNCMVNYTIGTLDLHDLENLEMLECGWNALTSLNVTGCTGLLKLDCTANQIPAIDLSTLESLQVFTGPSNSFTELDFSHNPLSSQYTFNGVIYNQASTFSSNPNLTYVNFKNGTTPLWGTYSGSDLANLQSLVYLCVDNTPEDLAYYNAFVTAGISVNTYCSFTPGGDYNTISGTGRYDSNTNGCDATDAVYPFMKMNINDGVLSGSTFTNTTGNYSFFTEAGTFSVTPDIENSAFFSVSAPASVAFPSDNNLTAARDFCVAPIGVLPDLEIVITPITPARPGFDAVYKIVYRNKGNQVMGAAYGITFSFNDNLVSFVSASPDVISQVGGTIAWGYADLMPFESRSILVTMHVNAPTATNPVNVGDVLTLTAIVSPQAADESVNDNTFQFNQTVVGSYDPNDITCIEGDVVSPDEIGEYLHYVVRFENTGTYPAENIVVKNVIDAAQFDVNSLRVLSSSHSVDIRITGNVAEYIFKNINLGIGGHGNILLKLKTQNTLAVGTTVSNAAGIYFDYNLPVDTNIANTTFELLAVGEHNLDASISVYPNPADGIVNIKSDNVIKSVEVYDIQGRILQHVSDGNNITSVSIDGYGGGIYFLKIRSDKGIRIEKIMKK
jgi:uncharacterized repeat protein (TIGR01451 family)